MNAKHYKTLPLAAAITAAIVMLAPAAHATDRARAIQRARMGHAPTASTVVNPNPFRSASKQVGRYIVSFQEAPLAQYDGSNPQLAAIPRIKGPVDTGRLAVRSLEARQYVSYLDSRQQSYLAAIEKTVGHPVPVRQRFQYALNAAVVEMSATDAARVAKMNGVAAVSIDEVHPLATDIGPGFIGASNLWFGQPAGQDDIFIGNFDSASTGYRGEGMVVADFDTGYNSLSPSFAATDDSGYSFINPLGAGNYLGDCHINNISLAGCNDKVIGVFDLVSDPAPVSAEDYQGHGSHTASTIAGNARWADYNGYHVRISGVAPHANLIVYYICSPDGCANSAAAAAAESVVADGVASAINFSISGGTHPWGGVVEQAFLSATSAGVFVAAAAGNTNQTVPNAVAGTAQHWEPWVTTVAAGTHTGGAISSLVDVTGPGTPPSSVMGLYANPAVDGTPPSAAVPGTTPLVLSPQFQNQTTTGNDGCSPYAADTFANSIALVSRGGCAFYIKAINAAAAGATAVLISNNRTGGLIPVLTPDPGQPVVAVPVWGMTQADASSLQGFLLANSGTTASVSLPGRIAVQPDVLGDFSLLGPGGSGVIKPDVQAPGVSILAAIANDGSAAGPSLVSLYDGTSMATPHTTGAATLLMGLHPDWTPSEVKSALMMTAKETGLTKPDMVTPSDYYDRGAGRIRVDIASAAGLVMDETRSRYLQADPAMGGDPATLNLPSMEDLTCYSPAVMGCSFVRTFRSTVAHTVNWTASITGPAAGAISLLPGTTFSTLPNGAVSVQLDVDSSAMPADGTPQFAELTLAPDDGSPDLHLPISVAMQAPVISVQPMVNLDLAGAATGQTTVQVANVGGPGLQFQQETDTSAFNSYVVNDYAGGSGRGYFSTKFSDAGFGFYAAQPFVITGYAPVNLSTIIAPGFEIGSGLASFGPSTPLHIAIYADDGGKPAGNPEAASPAPVWSLDTTLGGAEIYLAGDTILAFPTTSTQLVPGKYWLSVYPELPCNANTAGNCTDGWAWRLDTNANSPVGASIFPAGQSPGNTWQPVVEQRGFALYLDSTQTCSAPAWLGLSPGSGALDAGTSMPLTVTATAASMTAAQATSYLCLSSNTVPTYNSPSLIQVNVKK